MHLQRRNVQVAQPRQEELDVVLGQEVVRGPHRGEPDVDQARSVALGIASDVHGQSRCRDWLGEKPSAVVSGAGRPVRRRGAGRDSRRIPRSAVRRRWRRSGWRQAASSG